jgi:hypothetical protein
VWGTPSEIADSVPNLRTVRDSSGIRAPQGALDLGTLMPRRVMGFVDYQWKRPAFFHQRIVGSSV